eukprot:252495_1
MLCTVLLAFSIFSNTVVFGNKKINGIDCISIHEIFDDPLPSFSDKLNAPSSVDIYFGNGFSDYFISVNNKTWLQSGTTGFRNNGKWADLKISKTQNNSGYDSFGKFNEVVITYQDQSQSVAFSTHFKYYPSNSDILLFTQTYPNGAVNTAVGNQQGANMVISSFPSFQLQTIDQSVTLGYTHFGGYMSASEGPQFGTWSTTGSKSLNGGIQETGPLAIFDDKFINTIVVSPLTDHMAVNDYKNGSYDIEYGLIGNITTVPIKYSVSFILTLTRNGGGINKGMQEWGNRQLQYYGVREKGNSHNRDFTLQYLGYSTDNGAYYYYYTEPGKNYQQTMIDISNYHKSVGLPTKWVLLDSWWYYKGAGGGVKNWTARSDIFPNGLEYVYNATGWSIQAHNRYWSTDNVYKGVLGYNFTCSNSDCLPDNSQFWDYLFNINENWGLVVYEQDWIRESTVLPNVINNTYFGRQWLLEMGQNAYEHHVSVQYCMCYPRHIMTTSELASVTQTRASDDYHPGNNQWRIGISSIFNSAIDIAPSKDNFWSKPDIQPGPYSNTTCEPYNRLQALVQSLSNGPYTFSDQIGYSDVDLIMRCCSTNGLVLRPDTSATMIDAYFKYRAGFENNTEMSSGEIWSTTSRIGNNDMFRYIYVFAVLLNNDLNIYPNDVSYHFSDNSNNEWLVYESNTTSKFTKFNYNTPLTIKKGGKYDFQLYTLIPIGNSTNSDLNGWYLQGEIDKWITVSKQRFKDITTNNNGNLMVQITGEVGETVNIGFVKADTLTQQIVKCKIDETQQMVIRMPDATCLSY